MQFHYPKTFKVVSRHHNFRLCQRTVEKQREVLLQRHSVAQNWKTVAQGPEAVIIYEGLQSQTISLRVPSLPLRGRKVQRQIIHPPMIIRK